MSLFSSRIKVLEGQVQALTTERDQLAASNLELTGLNAECATQHAADQASILTLTGERDSARANVTLLTTERDTALADLKAEKDGREAAISAEVTKRLGSAGVDPVRRDPAALDNKGEPKTQGTARERLAASINSQLQK